MFLWMRIECHDNGSYHSHTRIDRYANVVRVPFYCQICNVNGSQLFFANRSCFATNNVGNKFNVTIGTCKSMKDSNCNSVNVVHDMECLL